ncbi:sensor histidine kinase [Deinococcus sedimenti]|uniref:histidine kinase n=1 Tax=Deinococcus sedimenti TaxID=1867090 RepID=A0ABQ2S876_9DEIO|nr:PAS domain-containing sensor histidine kinase [Deinococcus sedimenti]GGS07235.1 hypothetical protein GCM10008960_37120 [Deinococcus sedimenti]
MARAVWRWTLPLWLAVTLAGSWGLVSERRAALQAAFELDARVLHRVLSQRLEQQETVLSAVAALLAQDLPPGKLGGYVQALVRPYGQIVAVEGCAAAGCRSFTFRREELPDLPFAPAPRPAVRWPRSGSGLYVLTLGRARVWVNAAALVSTRDLPAEPLSVQLFRPETGELLVDRAAPVRQAAFTFTVRKSLGTALEPFPIRFERAHPWQVWPWAGLLFWWTTTTLIAGGAARILSIRARAEQSLLDERRRAQGVVQASTDGIVVLDAQGSVVQANPAALRIMGPLPAGQAISGAARFQATLSQAPFDAARFWRATDAQALPDGTALRRGAEQVLIEGGLTPLTGDRGQLLGRVLTVREVGPLQQRLLAQLDAGERRVREHESLLSHVSRLSTLGEMSAGLAHELNQPLTAIVSYGQGGLRLLTQDPPDVPRARQAVQGMVTQAQRSAEIIARLRTLVRRAPAQRAKVDLVQAAQNILILCHADLTRQGVHVAAQFPAAAFVTGDPVQVEQILLNLVRNALDAMGDRPDQRLDLQLSAAGDAWALTVQDSGTGLSDAVRATLFQPFQTVKPGGLGLGLSLSQSLAQGLGGDLSGENAPGRGARFTLTLPQWSSEPDT